MDTLSKQQAADYIAETLWTNGIGNKTGGRIVAERIAEKLLGGPKVYSVTINSEDRREGQWIDTVWVLAADEDEARDLARDHVNDIRDTAFIEDAQTEVYALKGENRVFGRLINTDEE